MVYNEQEDALERMLAEKDEDVFVSPFSVLATAAGQKKSYSVWNEGVETLLPETDLIAFIDHTEQAQLVDRRRVIEVVGDLIVRLDMYPMRYRVKKFPSEAQRAAMGNLME